MRPKLNMHQEPQFDLEDSKLFHKTLPIYMKEHEQISHHFGFCCVTFPQPLNLPCVHACGKFKNPMSSVGSAGSLVAVCDWCHHETDNTY